MFSEGPLLGKISRTRRAKSAHLRNSSAKAKLSDKRKLVKESDSSSTDTVLIDEQAKTGKNLGIFEPKMAVTVKKEESAQTTAANIHVSMQEEQL